MKKYYIGIDIDKYKSYWAISDYYEFDQAEELGLVEVGWFDFWLYRIFGIIPKTTLSDKDTPC